MRSTSQTKPYFTALACATVFLAMILTGCPTDDLNDRLKALEAESAKWREVAQVASQSAIRAVPGERYLQLIDDLNGEDVSKRQRAQTFLKKLGAFDPSIEWEATVYFGFNEAKPIHGDAFFSFSNSRAQVELYVPDTFNAHQSLTNTISLPPTAEDVNQTIEKSVDQMMPLFSGTPLITAGVSNGTGFSMTTSTMTWPDSIAPTFQFLPFPAGAGGVPQPAINKKNQVADTQRRIAVLLKQALRAQYEQKAIPVGNQTLTRQWQPIELKNYLFVLIPDDDYQSHKNDANFQVSALIHKKGDTTDTLNQTSPMMFERADFDLNPPVERPKGEGKVRWAVKNLTGNAIYMPDDLEKIKAMQKTLEELNKLNSSLSAQPSSAR